MKTYLGYGGCLLLVSGQPSASAASTCEYNIQKACLFERVPATAAGTAAADKGACLQCAMKHKTALTKVCPGGNQQVEQFCGSTKPVIGGYDVVQYFSLQATDAGVLGSPAFAYNFTSPDSDGTPRFKHEFWFVSGDNRDKFASDPWKYAPKNGGF